MGIKCKKCTLNINNDLYLPYDFFLGKERNSKMCSCALCTLSYISLSNLKIVTEKQLNLFTPFFVWPLPVRTGIDGRQNITS